MDNKLTAPYLKSIEKIKRIVENALAQADDKDDELNIKTKPLPKHLAEQLEAFIKNLGRTRPSKFPLHPSVDRLCMRQRVIDNLRAEASQYTEEKMMREFIVLEKLL